MSIDGSTITAQSVVLMFSTCADATVGPVRYIVTYRSDNGNELSVETTTSRLNVMDLRPGKQYTYRIQCKNSAGMTGPSMTKYATTLSEGLFVKAFQNKM